MSYLGIDLGGTKIELIALDDAGRECLRFRRDTPPDDYEKVIDGIGTMIREARRRLDSDIKGIGIGVPGAVDPKTSIIHNVNLPHLNGRNLRERLKETFNFDVTLENDANCFALSEAKDGAGKNANVLFAAILGTGCGAGIVINGRLMRGGHNAAGEWGRNPISYAKDDDIQGRMCNSGQKQSIGRFVSGTGFEIDYALAATKGEVITKAHEIVQRAESGDAIAATTLRKYSDRLARGLISVINVLNPDTIVLGGGMSNIDSLYETVPRDLDYYLLNPATKPKIVKNKHGDSSGVRGGGLADWESLSAYDVDTQFTDILKFDALPSKYQNDFRPGL